MLFIDVTIVSGLVLRKEVWGFYFDMIHGLIVSYTYSCSSLKKKKNIQKALNCDVMGNNITLAVFGGG